MLLDTSGLLALVQGSEPHHVLAHQLYARTTRRVIHNLVLAEWVTLAHVRGVPRRLNIEYLVDLVDNPEIEVFWVDEGLHRAAAALIEKRLDKTYSLCDAVSFVLMRRLGIADALTTDQHFEQEGFRRLLV